MALQNLFRLRYTEQQKDSAAFLRTFGVGMLDVLPDAETAWNRLVVIRSAPGAGKTSILRLLAPEALVSVLMNEGREESIKALHDALTEIGVLGVGLERLGIMISVGRDYKTLLDLGPDGTGNQKIFFKLLDARILTRAVESVLTAAGLNYPADANRVDFVISPTAGGEAAREAIAQMLVDETIGDTLNGQQLLDAARAKERNVLSLLDSLLPVEWDNERGHSRMYSVPLLGNVEIRVDGATQTYQPVLMFDDVHDLAVDQRAALYEQLLDRSATIGRWIAERKSAVPHDELLIGTTQGRDYELVILEEALMTGARGGRTSPRLDRILGMIANARAAMPLSSAGVAEPFTSLLGVQETDSARYLDASQAAETDTRALAEQHPNYREWIRELESRTRSLSHIDRAIAWRERRILMERDISRSQPTLFDLEVGPERAQELSSPQTMLAARLFVSKEGRLPYYYGPETIADLASRNVEQYLGIAGDLFEIMGSAVTLRRGARLSPAEQDQRIRRSSQLLWEAVPRRVEDGRDVLALLHLIADRARVETFRSTAPYAPGVTGAGIGISERAALFASQVDDRSPRSRLARAIGSAVANNLLEMSTEPTKTKGREWAVLYLNRLLCPHFDLPLQRGGWREQSIAKLATRLELTLSVDRDSRIPDPETPLSHIEGWPR